MVIIIYGNTFLEKRRLGKVIRVCEWGGGGKGAAMDMVGSSLKKNFFAINFFQITYKKKWPILSVSHFG